MLRTPQVPLSRSILRLSLCALIVACGSEPVFIGFPSDDATGADSTSSDTAPGTDAELDTPDEDGGEPDTGEPDTGEPDVVEPDATADVDEDPILDVAPDVDDDPDTAPDVEEDADPDADAGSDVPAPRCGDGSIDPGELCDGSAIDATCADFAFDAGALTCSEDCLRYDFDGCSRDVPPECGDGTRDDGELCDGADLDGVTCEGLGFDGGTITCRDDCAGFALGDCEEAASCGDGFIDAGELCDGDAIEASCADLGFDAGELECDVDCSGYVTGACTGGGEPVCGDGTQEGGELCDGDDLSADCGDLGYDRGELLCRTDCAGYDAAGCELDGPVCGDGVRDAGELCDTGAVDATCAELGFDRGVLGCAPGCAGYETGECINDAVCGDGVAEDAEVCDRDDLELETCRTLGFEGGTLLCELDCTAFDTGACVTASDCGNGVRDTEEVCDGDDLGGATCVGRGFDAGELACRADCSGFDESACIAACVPACGARRCGPDPVCGDSCGDCDSGEHCTAAGACELDGPSGPLILRFNTDVFDLSEGETVTFSAVVTDPDGIEDLIGGTLDDPVTGRSYGSFSTSSSEGAYGLTLTWEQIHRTRLIEFTEDTPRTFEAVFFDVSGSDATARLDITLTCDGDFACDGACLPAGTTDNCTACDDVCAEGALCGAVGCECDVDEEVCDGVCTSITTTADCGACDNVCAPGGSCVDALCVCGVDEAICGGACTDLTTTSDCGSCGNECAAGALCTDGACVCDGELDAVCGDFCVDLDADDNCGACGNVCLDGATCDGRACVCDRPDIYCPGVGCVDPSWIDSCGACDTECTLAYQTCTATGCGRAAQGDIRTNSLGYTDVRFGSNWRPLCEIYSFQQAEGACESVGMDLEYFQRDVVRSDHTDGAGIQVDFFCPGENLSSLGECDLSYEFCGGGLNGYYSTVNCIESRSPATDGAARFDSEGRPQVFYDDRWWTLTWGFGYFRDDAATVFCESMGLDFVSRAEGPPTTVDDGFCMGAFECEGGESSLADCVEYGWGQLTCGQDRLDRVTIVCE